jgi:antibiotic biosynthesis monooxygenase (ABM) superfamily enzyme
VPFGLDIKSLIVGILLAWFVVPYITALINRPGAQRAAA